MFSLLNTCIAEHHIYDRFYNYSYISMLCLLGNHSEAIILKLYWIVPEASIIMTWQNG